MKTLNLIVTLGAVLIAAGAGAAEIKVEFADVSEFTDFSVNGISPEKTMRIFHAELESEGSTWAKKFLQEGQVLTLQFTDIDMAGDIQPWRNRFSADIRYVEAIYPPRLKFHYTLADAEGNVLKEGDESISDMNFQMNLSATIRLRHETFTYELELLQDWFRKSLRQD